MAANLTSQGLDPDNGIRAVLLGGPVPAPSSSAPRSNRPTAIAVDLLLSLQLRANDGREELDLDGDSRHLQPPDTWLDLDLDLDPPWRELATAAIVDPRILDAMLPFSLDRRITDVLSLDCPIWSDSTSAASFLASVDSLLDLEPPAFDRADDLLQQCVLRLEDEFKTILEGSAVDPIQSSPFESDDEESDRDDEIPVAKPVTNYDIIIDAIPMGSISDLNEIAKRVAAAGFGREIAHVYSLSRRDFLDESLSRLGLRPKTVEEIHSTSWNLLDDEIQRWIRGVTLAVRVLFPSERRLCERIFANLSPIAELAYAESCSGSAIQLIDFADAIAIGSKSPERIFKVFSLVCKRWLRLQNSDRRRLRSRAGPDMLRQMAARFSGILDLDLSQSTSRSFYPGVTDSDLIF